MKSHTRYVEMNVPARLAFVNITGEVAREVAQSGITERLCVVNAMHITASVFIRRSGLCRRRAEAEGRSRRRR